MSYEIPKEEIQEFEFEQSKEAITEIESQLSDLKKQADDTEHDCWEVVNDFADLLGILLDDSGINETTKDAIRKRFFEQEKQKP